MSPRVAEWQWLEKVCVRNRISHRVAEWQWQKNVCVRYILHSGRVAVAEKSLCQTYINLAVWLCACVPACLCACTCAYLCACVPACLRGSVPLRLCDKVYRFL